MAGRKTFTAGEVLQAADVNDFLMDQSVMVFAGTAARGSAIPSPTEGMVTYLADSDQVQVYNGSSFGPIGTILQVVSTTKTDTFSASVTAAGNTAITGLAASITPSSASNKILILVNVGVAADATGIGRAGIAIHDGSSLIGIGATAGSRTSLASGIASTASGNSNVGTSPSTSFLDSPATTSSVTYTVHAVNNNTSTQTLYINRSESDADNASQPRGSSTITLMEVAG